MQYCTWAEMHTGGYQPSLDEGPSNSMFEGSQAGGEDNCRYCTSSHQSTSYSSYALPPSVAVPTSHSSLVKTDQSALSNLECKLEFCPMRSRVVKEYCFIDFDTTKSNQKSIQD